MQIPIIMPQLGESIAEAAIVNFLVQPGDQVEADQNLIEVETNKATMTVTSPCNGRLTKFTAQLHESYPVDASLGEIEATAAEVARLGLDVPPPKSPGSEGYPKPETVASQSRVQPRSAACRFPPTPPAPVIFHRASKPAWMNSVCTPPISPGVAGSGAAGRVTVEDFEKYIASLEKHKMSGASSMRVAVADAMRRSWTRPLATVGLPVMLDAVLAHRKSLNPKPGPALYALRALAVALAENSAVAGRLIGNKIVHPSAIDVGFAVEAEDGVLVPVIRQADQKPLQDLTQRYNELVELARQAQAARGRRHRRNRFTATVTNFGTFRADLGHADPAAGTNPRAWARGWAARAAVGRSQGKFCARDGG